MEPYSAGARDLEKYVFPVLTKVSVTINSSCNILYNEGISSADHWAAASPFFMKEKIKQST